MGWQDWLGINQINQDFGYDAAEVGYNPYGTLTDTMGSLGQRATGAFGKMNTLFDMAGGLMAGESPYLKSRMEQLRTGTADIGTQQTMAGTRALAARGMGGGGLANILGTKTASAMGEQYKRGLTDIMGLGFQAGQNFYGQSLGFGGLGGNLLSQKGQLAAGVDARTLQAQLDEARRKDQASQYENSMDYQQAQQNRAQRAGFANSLIGLAGGPLTGGVSGFLSGLLNSGGTTAGGGTMGTGTSLAGQNYGYGGFQPGMFGNYTLNYP